MNNQLWGAVVVIVLGYVLGFYFQSGASPTSTNVLTTCRRAWTEELTT